MMESYFIHRLPLQCKVYIANVKAATQKSRRNENGCIRRNLNKHEGSTKLGSRSRAFDMNPLQYNSSPPDQTFPSSCSVLKRLLLAVS